MSTLFSHFFTNFNQISPLEADFTEVLSTIALVPKTLYFHGKMPQNMLKNGKSIRPKVVAIVGSRHNTSYGEEVAYQLGYELGRRGVVVVSGLAYGIDSIGHRGCLAGGGTTVAVLGTPITEIYPKAHVPLARQIVEQGGAIISEYAPDATVYPKTSFLERNRLISGLADIVVVVEAAERSGSLNTATHALAQGREVFAVPGHITAPYSQGCNKLIAQGAQPYTEPADVLRLLFPEDYVRQQRSAREAGLVGDSDIETKVLRAIHAGARNGEDVMRLAVLPPEVFNQAVTLLEIKGRIRALGANRWALC